MLLVLDEHLQRHGDSLRRAHCGDVLEPVRLLLERQRDLQWVAHAVRSAQPRAVLDCAGLLYTAMIRR